VVYLSTKAVNHLPKSPRYLCWRILKRLKLNSIEELWIETSPAQATDLGELISMPETRHTRLIVHCRLQTREF